jgi:voltage-gated potassium channel
MIRKKDSRRGQFAKPSHRRRPARRVMLLLAAIVLIFGYGTCGYMLMGFGFVDALYMTSLALTTAGFNPVGELDQTAKVFTVTVAVLGVSAFLAVLGILTTALTERQFTTQGRRRRMERRIEALRDHHVICTYGRVGRTVAREYEGEGVSFVVIDPKEDLEEQMRADGVPYIIADPSSEEVLRRAGVQRARGLVCAVDSDASNVYIALTARFLNPDIFIVARAGERGSAERLFRAGADRVVSPYVTSGRHMALVSLRPRVVDFFEVVGLGGGEARLDELVVEEGSPLVGRSLTEVCGPAVPLLLRRGDGQVVANPRGDERLAPEDLIFLYGEPGALRAIEENLG